MADESAPTAPLWSKIGTKVNKSPEKSPQAAKPAASTPAKKNTAVLKPATTSSPGAGNASGFSPLPSQKRWSEYDDNDDFFAEPPVDRQALRIAELEKVDEQKTARVHELEKELEEKAAQIMELERMLESKNSRIASLESTEATRETMLGQYSSDIADNNRTIEQLTEELDLKTAHIRQLELQAQYHVAYDAGSAPQSPATAVEHSAAVSDGSEAGSPDQATQETENKPITTPETPNTAEIPAVADQMMTPTHEDDEETKNATRSEVGEETQVEIEEDNQVEVKEEIVEAPHEEMEVTKAGTAIAPEMKALELSQEEYPTLAPSSPVKYSKALVSSSTDTAHGSLPVRSQPVGPVFATPQTIKDVPPVPPAPVLKMGVDMSKWGKKPVAKAGASSRPKGFTAKRTVNPTIVPSIDTGRDVRKMLRSERGPLGNGGGIEVKMGNQVLGKVAKYMFMQCSHIANKHLTENPKATSVSFPEHSMDATAAKSHIDWMNDLCVTPKVFSISLDPESDDDLRNMNIIRAARVLGLNNIYVGHFTRLYCDMIRQENVSWSIMELIAALVYPGNDPIFECLANNIVTQRRNDNVAAPESLQAYLDKYPTLARRIDQIERQASPAGKARPSKKKGDRSSLQHSGEGSK